ncbi:MULTISPECIES: M48 family metallopeptidase [unclassified Nitratiruptor]|uniref:M48 family metallopeptidase n=1 Tax=unclassified Nitratiruptor TaxID=2624044 RepID=UPI00191543AA|nr:MULTISPECIES: SprT family zinc-dependent metalloprotease [unclassified Nitratiruptor]BCD59421.1 hypothetical protein NitYY0810_C0157 [Nitratiruptor sp. YY08-10]BCD63345.1 hypothetical protein NitYY0814_C0157 [Nitratiruptor sp. YY08-14]
MQFRLKRERRKSLKIEIQDEEVIVKAPYWISKRGVDLFIKAHRSWIEKELQKASLRKKRFCFEEKFLLLGGRYPLRKGNKELCFQNGSFWVEEPSQEAFQTFYKNFAMGYLRLRTKVIAAKYNCLYNDIKITGAKKRWGSCTSKRNINFSYRVVMLPPDLIDYIIVHELSHLTYMNHSKAFWSLVHSRMPDYKERHRRIAAFLVDDI